MAALKFVVFLGTVRENNFGSRVAKYVVRKLEEKGNSVTLLDPAELKLPLMEKAFHFYDEGEEVPKVLAETNKVISEADAYVIVTAEYNHSLPPALTNLMDYFYSYKHRPSGIVCYSYGPYAGVRAAMQARAFLAELGTPSVGTLFPIATVHKALTPEGVPTAEPEGGSLDRGAERLISELQWYAVALKKQRETAGLPK